MATKRAPGWRCAEAIARQPEPVPTSTARGDCEVAGLLQVFDDHEFRFRTGNQHGRRDREGERIKLLASDEIGHRRTRLQRRRTSSRNAVREAWLTSSSKWV